MKPIASLVIALIVIVVAIAGYHFSGSQVKKRATQAALSQFADAVATKDLKKVQDALGSLLTDDAKIRLEVHFFSIGNDRPAMEQNFDKTQFIKFIDNTLYSLVDYSYTPTLQTLDKETGAVVFTSGEWADGKNMMGGVSVDMRYSSSTECTGNVAFENEVVRLKNAVCKMQFRQVPKPGQEGKFLSKKNLNDLLGIPPQQP